MRGDEVSGSTFWHGALLNRRAIDWFAYWTGGRGRFVMTAMEETGTLQALSFLASARRVDLSRILVLRTGSNYTMPPSGMSAAESLTAMSLTQSPGYLPALEAAYADGQRVGIGLAQTELETARGRLVASEVDDGDGTVDRLDAEAARSAKSSACRPTPQPRSSTCCAPRAFGTGTTAGCGTSQSARPSGVIHRSSHASTAVAAICASAPYPPLLWRSS